MALVSIAYPPWSKRKLIYSEKENAALELPGLIWVKLNPKQWNQCLMKEIHVVYLSN